MDNKKIPAWLGIVIIIIFAITVGAFVWKYKQNQLATEVTISKIKPSQQQNLKQENKSTPSATTNSSLKQTTLSNEEIELLINQSPAFPDIGTAPKDGNGIIFSTRRYFGSQCNKNRNQTQIFTYYIRSIDGSFSRRLFYDKDAGYSFALSKDKNEFSASKYNAQSYLFDFSGNTQALGKSSSIDISQKNKKYYNELTSPDGKFIARNILPDADKGNSVTAIELHNNLTGEDVRYDFGKEYGFNGIYVNAWKSDSKSVYIAGGIYEFSAPANLWRIDIGNPNPHHFKQFEGMVYPISINSDENVAFARDKDHFSENPSKDIITNLYMVDLTSEKKEKIITESAYISRVFPFYSSKAFYQVCKNFETNSQSCNVRYFDISDNKNHLFADNLAIIGPVNKDVSTNLKNEGIDYFISRQNNSTYISSFNNPSKKILLGKEVINCNDVIEGVEYSFDIPILFNFSE